MLRALYIGNNPGTRAVRILRATQGMIHWTLVARGVRDGVDIPARVERWWTAEELKNLLEQPWAQECPLWVVAQQLDAEWVPPFVSLCRGQSAARIVVDVRDMTSLLPRPVVGSQGRMEVSNSISLDELSTFRIADGTIHISGQIATAAQALHRMTPPTYVLPCFVNRSDLVDYDGEKRGLVYSGGIGPPGGTFRSYHELFEALAPHEVHVYGSPSGPNWQEIFDTYTLRGCHVHGHIGFNEVIPALARHRWGIVGFPHSFPLGNGALPNKLFEYFAAGLPVVVVNADAAGSFVLENRLGIWVQDQEQFEHLGPLLERHYEECRRNVLARRDEFTMDYRAGELQKFFQRVLKIRQARPGGLRIALESTTVIDNYGPDCDLEVLFGGAR